MDWPAQREWLCRDRSLSLGEKTRIMGVVNVTPDSFSDGGQFDQPETAVAHSLALDAEGADVLDVGGESSRPGATPISESEELARVLPVVQGLSGLTQKIISVDTTKANVAAAVLEAGAHVINDISALEADPEMVAVCREARAGVVVMHRQGLSCSMQDAPKYTNCLDEVRGYLELRVAQLVEQGIEPASIVLDPGIGFGKTLEHNLALLRGIPELKTLGLPVLIGLSRKRMLGELTGRDTSDRMAASLGGLAFAIQQGADIIRVHDVQESCDVSRILDILNADCTS